jgi:hypothetical protein
MTATNIPFEGMKNDADSARLAAVAETVERKHALEPDNEKRQSRWIVIYPPELDKLEAVLATGDISLDSEEGHGIAYQRILEASLSYQHPPGFSSSNSQDSGGLEIAGKMPELTRISKQVSIGGRRQVREDGKDVCDSESDPYKEDHGETLTGMYTSEIQVGKDGKPISNAYKLSNDQANAMRAAAVSQAKEFRGSTARESAAGSPDPTTQSSATTRTPTPLNSDDEYQVPYKTKE